MSLISGVAAAAPSPLSSMQALLQRDVSTGAIAQTDQAALSSALSAIGAQIGSQAASSQGTARTAGAGTGPIGSKVGTLIDAQVSSGALTSDQASELKGLFAQAHQHMHVGHHHGGGGGALSSLLDTGSSDDGSTDGTASSLSAPDQAITSLASFVNGLRSAVKGGGLYGAAGAGTGGIGSLLVSAFA